MIKWYYKRMNPPTKVNGVTVMMIKQKDKGPKFRGKGAETRHLVPFSLELSQMMAAAEGGTSSFYNQIVDCSKALLEFYGTYGFQPYDAKRAASSARQFCILYASISETQNDKRFWKISPKFHMFTHLSEHHTEESGDPSRFWAYKDEDFVGLISTYAQTRGGKRIETTTPKNVMSSYRSLV